MVRLNDKEAATHWVRLHANTSRGRVNFYTDTGNKHLACARLKEQTGCKWVDVHHAAISGC